MIVSSGPAIAPISIEQQTMRKLKIRILPFILLLYIVAFLDRINIGFAALTMNRELAITSHQFGLLAGIFFAGYSICEIPSNLLLHKIGARIWIARILITWGMVAALTGFVFTVRQLYLARFLLGVAEGGYFPGMLLYLTYWFRQREQARVIALVLMGIPITNVVGAPVSGLILDHVHWLGFASWRWLLILEGIPALVCGVLTYYLLPSRPAEATFLAEEEKSWIIGQLELEEEKKRETQRLSATGALMHKRVWHLACIALALGTALYIVNFWLPQTVKALASGSSNTVVGLLVMVPNLVGLLLMIIISRHSDEKRERRWHAAVPALAGGIACLFLIAPHSTIVSIALLSLLAVGVYGAVAPFWAIPSEFLTGFSAAAGIALISSIANIGGFVGPYAVGFMKQKTGNLQGSVALAGIALLVFAILLLLLPKKRV